MNANEKQTISLPAGKVLTVTPTAATGTITRLSDSAGGEPYSPVAIASSVLTLGPYANTRRYMLALSVGTLSYSIDDADMVSETEGAAEFASTAQGVKADSAVQASLVTSGDGAPDDAVQATLTVNPDGDDNGLIFTAVAYGTPENDISIEYLDPSDVSQDLAVSVVDSAISVSLATDENGDITSTAAEVKTAIEASAEATALVTVAADESDSNYSDLSGVVTAMDAANLASGVGTSIGVSLPGGLYIDYTNGNVYRNSGSQAVPAWTQLADAS